MPISGVAKKLLVKPGQRIALVNAPPDYAARLAPLPEGASITAATEEVAGPFDAVHLFVANAADLERFGARAVAAVGPGGMLWIAYRKGGAKAGTDLNRDILHAAIERTYGWTGVSLVAIDETWSGMRFRPAIAVGT